MKLSPQKVEQLSEELLDLLSEMDGVMFQGNDVQLKLAINEIITDELMVEDRLNDEVHQRLREHKTQIMLNDMNYDVLFDKIKRRIINERKLVL
ncbi:MAG: DUF507 family protein [Chloroflexaceae bacterium]|nr:DUF507 family protein [Chloroflexaceae bacterium]